MVCPHVRLYKSEAGSSRYIVESLFGCLIIPTPASLQYSRYCNTADKQLTAVAMAPWGACQHYIVLKGSTQLEFEGCGNTHVAVSVLAWNDSFPLINSTPPGPLQIFTNKPSPTFTIGMNSGYFRLSTYKIEALASRSVGGMGYHNPCQSVSTVCHDSGTSG